jgi:hypothetical protein
VVGVAISSTNAGCETDLGLPQKQFHRLGEMV